MEDDEEVAVPGYVRDVEELLRDYVQRGDPSLAAFKAVWRARRFSFVHDACPKDIDPRRFLQLLFGAALGFLQAVPSACGAPPATHCSPDATAAAAAGAAAAPETPSPDATAASADAPAAAANGNAAGAAEARQAAERVPFTHGQGAREGVAREEGEEGVEGGKGEEGRLFVGGRLLSAVGAVFTLYCLFNTQRTAPYPPTLIYLPIDSLRLLLLFAREAPHHRAWDAVAALQTLFFGPHPSHPFSPPPASSSSSSPFPNSSPPSSAFVVGAMPLPQQLQGDVQQRAAQARRLVEQQLRVMKQKLFAHLPIERHIQSDACEAVDVEQADAACWLYDNSLQRLRTCGLLTEGASFAQEGELAAVFSAYSAAREAAVGAIGQRES
ncbi:hypothetical protein CLOM_g23065 [Closterium sp. NIES-68]|nr:hypothetical protein CLOM_g23065 [Closterium sp. NIES-68]GJP73288.1 hypothetical protein CLOP_g4025 [Closterium sp. NIES-67]